MNKKIIILLLVLLLISSSQIFSQAKTAQMGKKIGLGIAIVDIKDLYHSFAIETITPQVFFPIKMSSNFMLEPGFGYFRIKVEQGSYTSTSTLYTIGIGLFPMTQRGCVYFYYGARFGLVAGSNKEEDESSTDEETISGFFVAPTLGGEYFFCENFSIGGEAQFRFASFKEEDDDDPDDTEFKASGTRALFFIRCYF